MTTDIHPTDEVAAHMGDGVFVLCQRDEQWEQHSVTVTWEDLERLMTADG